MTFYRNLSQTSQNRNSTWWEKIPKKSTSILPKKSPSPPPTPSPLPHPPLPHQMKEMK